MDSGRDILKQKTFDFSLKIIAFCRQLIEERREYILSRQLLKSGTAIGALVSEAKYAESMADFIHKMSIALKECNETEYWLSLLFTSEIIHEKFQKELMVPCKEISYMLIATIKSAKKKIKQ